ncbi:unnamed protein product [Toxocara canis]|uniref:Uncharacterized protein n=1 Tax=Toxocara canis TaxID=6265 RepID=A0A183UDW2_TOXCA|nr:unnamed protein product [Toxocara canis]
MKLQRKNGQFCVMQLKVSTTGGYSNCHKLLELVVVIAIRTRVGEGRIKGDNGENRKSETSAVAYGVTRQLVAG